MKSAFLLILSFLLMAIFSMVSAQTPQIPASVTGTEVSVLQNDDFSRIVLSPEQYEVRPASDGEIIDYGNLDHLYKDLDRENNKGVKNRREMRKHMKEQRCGESFEGKRKSRKMRLIESPSKPCENK